MDGTGPVLPIDTFVEKPDIERARQYFESGKYFWNSGIFVWKTSVILEQYRTLLPDLVEAFTPLAAMSPEEIASNDGPPVGDKEKDLRHGGIRIDRLRHHGTRAENRVVIPGDFGWTDLGSWKSIDEILPPDGNGNRSPEKDRAMFLNSNNCSVFTENRRIAWSGFPISSSLRPATRSW